MKKFICLITLSIFLVSCDCPYWYFDDEPNCDEYTSSSIHYSSDVFYADILLGTWQCEYGFIVGEYEFKQIKFLDGNIADITIAKQYDTDWFTYTYSYSYYGNQIRFTRNGRTIQFNMKDYIFPQLFLQDSFGVYTIKKVKSSDK